MKKHSLWLVVTFVSLLIAGIFAPAFYREDRATKTVEVFINSRYWQVKMERFENCNSSDECIIFLGNSLTEGFDLTVFNCENLINMGISGDFTEGVLKRLDKVVAAQPAKLFLMIGINDIIEKVPMKTIKRNYREILTTVQESCPETQVYIQSNLPVHGRYSFFTSTKEINEKVIEFNIFLEKLSKEMGVGVIDLHQFFLKNGELDKNLTYDGIHLNKQGYLVWKKAIESRLEFPC